MRRLALELQTLGSAQTAINEENTGAYMTQ